MFLNSLLLKNFRSFEKKEISFSPKVTLIVGPNTAGKTNILEAVYLLATGKSFRAGRSEEMIRGQEELAKIEGLVKNGSGTVGGEKKSSSEEKLEIMLTRGKVQEKQTPKKIYKINGVEKKRKNFVKNFYCVLFQPQDLNLILGSPSQRRDYLDSVLEQIDWKYRSSLLTYKKGITKRNKLLYLIKKGKAKKDQLEFWNKLLVKNGSYLLEKREKLIEFYNSFLQKQIEKAREDDFVNFKIKIIYKKNKISEKRLENNYQKEISLTNTIVGPHRDDIKFSRRTESDVAGKISDEKFGSDLALYGSRGEQRMAVLWLKRAELTFIKEKTGQKPVLLLDDIFSELDKDNQDFVYEIIEGDLQAVITGTEVIKGWNEEGKTILI